MPENIKILTSRRGYEFPPDDLRLSMISTKPVMDHIQQMFHFQAAAIGSPMPTFGDVVATIPPGVVFDAGVWLSPDNQIVPIRFLHFEQQRIVIDIAGITPSVDEIFEHLMHTLGEIHAPDGSPIIGKPKRILNYSEISAQFSFLLDAILAPPLRRLLRRMTTTSDSEKDSFLIPTLALGSYSGKQGLASAPGANDPRTFTFAVRAGTQPGEYVYFSGAPLDSDAHLNYIRELEIALTSE